MNWNQRKDGALRSTEGYIVRNIRTRYGKRYVAKSPDGRLLGAQVRTEDEAVDYCEADYRRWAA